MSPRQRVPDYYEPPKVVFWAAAASLALGIAMAYVGWSGRGAG
jgi:hypothetical protein